MIDYHTHILPMMDDGSSSVEESEAMLRILKNQGADTVYLTPHFYIDQNLPEEFLERRNKSFEMIKHLQGRPDIPQLKLGAEVHYFEGITLPENLEKLKDLRLEDTSYLLLEMPFVQWSSRMIETIEKIAETGDFTVLLAHIDRYLPFNDMDLFMYLRSLGVHFQMNADYIESDMLHRRARKLFNSPLLPVISSDSHNMTTRRPNLDLIKLIMKQR